MPRSHRGGSRVIALLTPAPDRMDGQRHVPGLFTFGERPAIRCLERAGWDPGPVWPGAENLTTTRIQSPDGPDHSQSLYRMSYPGPHRGPGVLGKWHYLQNTGGTAVALWVRCCATNRKVAGSIPAGIIGIFYWHQILPIALWPWCRLSL